MNIAADFKTGRGRIIAYRLNPVQRGGIKGKRPSKKDKLRQAAASKA